MSSSAVALTELFSTSAIERLPKPLISKIRHGTARLRLPGAHCPDGRCRPGPCRAHQAALQGRGHSPAHKKFLVGLPPTLDSRQQDRVTWIRHHLSMPLLTRLVSSPAVTHLLSSPQQDFPEPIRIMPKAVRAGIAWLLFTRRSSSARHRPGARHGDHR